MYAGQSLGPSHSCAGYLLGLSALVNSGYRKTSVAVDRCSWKPHWFYHKTGSLGVRTCLMHQVLCTVVGFKCDCVVYDVAVLCVGRAW